MPVLYKASHWQRPRTGKTFDLTPLEQRRVKVALRGLREHLGSWQLVADALGCCRETAKRAARDGWSNGKRPSAGMALALARVMGVAVEDLLAGRLEGG